MRSEMDVMKMDERMRLCWLLANRMTLVVVGLVWLGMIAWELLHDRVSYFLIAMVPVFALIRLGLYQMYAHRNTAATVK